MISAWTTTLIATTLLAVSAQAPPSSRTGTDSVFQMTVEVPLAPLYEAIERHVPREVRQTGSWQRYHGVDLRYAARRGPLRQQMRGDTLYLQAVVGYWLKVRKRLLGKIPLSASCGLDEPPRGVALTLASRLGLRPDWRLASNTVVYPPRFLSPCQVSLARIDITAPIGRALERRLWRAARTELDRAVPGLVDLRAIATPAWKALQRPIAIAPETWLLIQPRAVSATPPDSDGRAVRLIVGLRARPRLVLGPRPVVEDTPLPELHRARTAGSGLRLPVRLALAYPDARRLLESRLKGHTLRWAGHEVTIEGLEIGARGPDLEIAARLSGAITGTVRLRGRPEIDEDGEELRIEGLDYALEDTDVHTRELDATFHDLALGVIAGAAHWPIRARLEALRERLEEGLDRPVGRDLAMRAELTSLRALEVRVTPSALVVEGLIEGLATLRPTGAVRGAKARRPPSAGTGARAKPAH